MIIEVKNDTMLEASIEKACLVKLQKENQELKNQQKEFIQWLENEIVDSMVGGIQQYYAKNHLKIYKEIIGDKYE